MKNFLTTLLAIASFTLINAQESDIRFGAKAGLNISDLTGDDADLIGYDSKTGFHIGAVVEIPISDTFAFQPELLFSTQGGKGEESGAEFISSINYLSIPLMAKLYVAEGLSLQAGPQISIMVSAEDTLKASIDTGFGEINIDESVDAKDDYKTIDLGLNFGLGYQLEMGLFLDARYNLGLTNIADYLGASTLKNSVFQISLGYKF